VIAEIDKYRAGSETINTVFPSDIIVAGLYFLGVEYLTK
jgi:hypothetical protein